VSEVRSARSGPARRFALLAAVAVLLGGAALAGCGDDEETASTPTTPDAEATGPTGPSDQAGGGGGGGGGGEDQTPADTGPTVPESGGVGADDHGAEQETGHDTEEDTEENDVPPPPGSPAEQFEQECEANPEIC
jgi:hypothetical protein